VSNFSKLMQLFAGAEELEDPFVTPAKESVLAPIGTQAELRFFVDGTANLGHQAATVHIMRRLIALTGFAGRATVVYADIRTDETVGRTPEKLALLMPGLDASAIDTAVVAHGSCRDIRFLNYDRRGELEGEVAFGFTAGADDMNINFARELKVRRFLRLQPYLWDDDASKKDEQFYESSRIETPAGEYFYPVDDYPPFRAIPYKYEARDCGTPDPDRAAAVWPVYGLHQFRSRARQIVEDMVWIGSRTGPVTILLINPPDEVGTVDGGQVSVVSTGPLSVDQYNSVYAHCGLPGVFEGQNTSSLMLSLGRPFLQLRRESVALESPYPAQIGGRDFAEAAARADAAAIALRDGRPNEVLSFIVDLGDPGSTVSRYFQELGRYYQQDVHDKLFAGLVALALSA
jgi:hypothetical protein